MAEDLSGWLLDLGDSQSDLATEVIGELDAWFTGEIGANWRNDDATGLASTLDVTPGWDPGASGKLESLKALVDDVRLRVRLIPPGYPLAAVLDGVWGDDSWRREDSAGLARALDQLPGWQNDSWVTPDLTLDTLRGWLDPVPAAWTGAPVLQDDPETGFKYDEAHWYLSDGTTIVNEDPANPGYFYDTVGNWYYKGQPAAAPAGAVAAADAGPVDLTVQHFDQQSRRWRRKYGGGDQDFEYYHDTDGVWEREINAQYPKRFHSDKAGWLSFYEDASAQWWLYDGQWLTWDDVQKSSAAAPAEDAPAENLQQAMEAAIEQTLGDMLSDSDLADSELSAEELSGIADEVRQELLAMLAE
jgi:hypothetical protein